MPRTLIRAAQGRQAIRPPERRQISTKSQVNVGRSLAADRRSKSKTIAKKGDGDRGDQKRRKTVKRKTTARKKR